MTQPIKPAAPRNKIKCHGVAFEETVKALRTTADNLSKDIPRVNVYSADSIWMDIQVIANVVLAMYKDLYEPVASPLSEVKND